jgi:hypothetical protein
MLHVLKVLCEPARYLRRDGGFENPQWRPGLVVEVKRKYAPKVGM